MLWYSAVIAAGLVALVWSADRFVEGASAIAKRVGLSPMVIGLTIVCIGTSLPEILVTATAAAHITPENTEIADLAIGGIFGSVLVQITRIVGVVVALRSVKVRPS